MNISVVDESYFALFSKNTTTLSDIYARSWDRGIVGTYISNIDLSENADAGAEKGGGGGDDGMMRREFKDTGVFETLRTDESGNASFKFKLPDNLTSWRITCQAVSDGPYAGSCLKNITVSLPFYVDMILGREYIYGDTISGALRVFGDNLPNGEPVEYTVRLKEIKSGEESERKVAGIAGEYTTIYFDEPEVGSYEVSVLAEAGDMRDGIVEEFKVSETTVYFNNTDIYDVDEGTVLNHVYSNPLITLYNASASDFYNSLRDMMSGGGRRIDQTVCSIAATKFIEENFEEDLGYAESELDAKLFEYKGESGGMKLLSYSSEDVGVTARLVHAVESDILDGGPKVYFNSILNNSSEYETEIGQALWGLSKYREPVLLTLRNLIRNEEKNLSAEDKLYLLLALAELGDWKSVESHYDTLIKENMKELKGYPYFDSGEGEEADYVQTALLTVLAGKMKDYENGDRLFGYLYNCPSKYDLSNFEQLIYIKDRNIMETEEIKNLSGQVTVVNAGGETVYDLNQFDTVTFAIERDKLKDIRFKNVKGSVKCRVDALGNKDVLDKYKTEDFGIDVSYTTEGGAQVTTGSGLSARINVTLSPYFKAEAETGFYEITYVIPSGFRYMGTDGWWWLDIDGQTIRTSIYYIEGYPYVTPVEFYIQAAQKGVYTADYVVIKEWADNRLNYVDQYVFTVD